MKDKITQITITLIASSIILVGISNIMHSRSINILEDRINNLQDRVEYLERKL